jgi:hypothetical protein
LTVSRDIVKLLFTPAEAWEYTQNPPAEANGISINWLEWIPLKPNESEKDQKVIAELITSDRYLVRSERKTEKDIRFLLGTYFRNRLLDRGLSHAASPRIALRIEAPLKHPLLSSPDTPVEMRRAAETARDVHEVKYTEQELKESAHPEIAGEYAKDAERGQRSRQAMKRFVVEPEYAVKEKIPKFLGQEKGYVEEEGEEKKVYVFGEIESG